MSAMPHDSAPRRPNVRPRTARVFPVERATNRWWTIAAALAVAVACRTPPPGGAPYPATASESRQPGETAVESPEAQEPIYLAVLRFYRPGPGQARWLDRSLLPEAAGRVGGELDPRLMAKLIAALGPDYCVRDAGGCQAERGGILTLSLPYRVSADTVRVVARFEGVAGPFAPGTAFSGTEGFLLVRAGASWTIAEHRPVRR
jgi:hypothetical protein